MTLPKYKMLSLFNTTNEIDNEILKLKKMLFDLRAKRAINKKIKSHLFIYLKRKIAQLNFKKTKIK